MKGNTIRKESKRKVDKPSVIERVANSYYVYPVFLIFVFLIYGQVLGFYLGKFDEDALILSNLRLLQDFSNIKLVLLEDAFLNKQAGMFYRPLQSLTYMIDAHFFFRQGSVFYLTNMLIHFFTGCALFYLLSIIAKSNKVSAFLLTMLFLGAPLFVHAVAWAPSRGDLLMGLFGLLTMIFFLRFIRSGNYVSGVLTALMFMLAVFSKETAIVLPLILIILYFIPSQEKKTTLLPALALAGMIAVISVLYLYLRSLAVQKVLSTDFGLIPMITNLRTLPEFIAKFFLPFFLAPMAGFTIFNTLAGLILIGLLIWLIVRASRPEWIALLAGLFWFLLLALPGVMYSHTLGSAAYDYLEQRAYFPSMGLILVLFFLIESPSNLKIRTKLMVAISSVTVVFSVYAHFYAKNYENPMTFYDHAIRSNPQSAVACLNRGLLRSEFKDFEGAMKDNVKALEVFPHYAQAWVNKGILLDHFNKDDEAVAAYDSALKYKPDLFQAHYNKANMVLRRGKYDLAIKEYDISIRLNPDYLPAYSARAMVNNQTKNYTAAINDLTHVIDNDPKAGTAYLNRGRIWFNLNKRENACSDWKNALNLGESEAKSLIQTYCKE